MATHQQGAAFLDYPLSRKEGNEMAIYHCSIKIISRAGGRSAVASAAYRSGEKLYNDETGLIHNFTRKGGVFMNEILLPQNAPERFLNREVLWNEVQQIEKRSDAQFAREVEVALPTEMSREEQIECVRGFIMENFVSKGMIADWALHDKNDGNPHAHIMLTIRGMDENAKWMQKQKTVFANALDEKGRAIYNPDLPSYDSKNREATSKYRIPQLDENGNQKTRVREGKGTECLWCKISIPANDWNDRANAEIWRESWAKHCNKYLDAEHQIDHRSYKRQGIDKEPTIHEGVTARLMEKDGKISDRCQQNREIKARNSLMEQMKNLASELTQLLLEKARGIYGRFKEFTGHYGNVKGTGRNDEHLGKPAERNRKIANGESELEGTTGRIHGLKRAADFTESEIAETDRQIEELTKIKKEKEDERNERLRKLKRRRASLNVGGDDGQGRTTSKSELRSTADDIESFIRSLDAKERTSEEKRDDSISKRENREILRERSRIEEERRIKERERELEAEREKNKRKSRSRGQSR